MIVFLVPFFAAIAWFFPSIFLPRKIATGEKCKSEPTSTVPSGRVGVEDGDQNKNPKIEQHSPILPRTASISRRSMNYLNRAFTPIIRSAQMFIPSAVGENVLKTDSKELESKDELEDANDQVPLNPDIVCIICTNVFTDETGDRIPRILTGCEHTICSQCVVKIININTKELKCPICRAVTQVAEGDVNTLRKNFSVIELVDEHAWKQRMNRTQKGSNNASPRGSVSDLPNLRRTRRATVSSLKCAEDPTHAAVLYCINCEASFCKPCSKSTHSSNFFSNHQLVNVSDRPEPPIYCPAHPHNIAELFCKNEKCGSRSRIMCHTCHLYGTHKNHQHELILKECEDFRVKIEEGMNKASEEELACTKHIQNIERCLETYDTETSNDFKKKQEQLHSFFSRRRTELDEWEKLAEKKLLQFTNEKYSNLQTTKQPYQNWLHKLKNQHETISELLEMETKQLLEKKSEGLAILDSISSTSIKNPEGVDASFDFVLNFPKVTTLSLEMVRVFNIYFVGYFNTGAEKIDEIIKKKAQKVQMNDKEKHTTVVSYENVYLRLWSTFQYQPNEPGVIVFMMDQYSPSTHDAHISLYKETKQDRASKNAEHLEIIVIHNDPQSVNAKYSYYLTKGRSEAMNVEKMMKDAIRNDSRVSLRYLYPMEEGPILSFINEILGI